VQPQQRRNVGDQRLHPRARTGHALVVFALVLALIASVELIVHLTGGKTADPASADPPPVFTSHAPATLGERIVETAESQLGYRTDPSNTYCNKYSAFFDAGNDDCGNSNLDEEWCADFAAWVWLKSGALVTYQFINGDLNSSAASFYEWGTRHGTWHPVGSGYVPQPGDVAVYGLDTSTLVASHVAVVIGYRTGDQGPNVVNGDGDRTGFSVVELGTDEYKADVTSSSAHLSGYTSPTPAG
jgi:hypothetical protein